MKIKKKDLRRGLAQVPINYPDPDVLPEALPDLGGVIDLDAEMVAVEALCKHLGHNEVALRSAVLEQVPVYIQNVFEPIAAMEAEYEGTVREAENSPSRRSRTTGSIAGGKSKKAYQKEEEEEGKTETQSEIASVTAYFAAHPSTPNPYYYHNLTEGLKVHREKVAEAHRREQRRASMKALKEKREEERRRKALAGRFGADAAAAQDESEQESEEEDKGHKRSGGDGGNNVHRERYQYWIQAWADLELVLLKLCRGLFFCLWHSDKPLDQLACADTIASFVAVPPTSRGQVLFASCLLRVLSREWPGIDHYRMDKYLALVRRVLQQVLLVMRRNCGSVGEEDGGRAHLFVPSDTTLVPAVSSSIASNKNPTKKSAGASSSGVTTKTTKRAKTTRADRERETAAAEEEAEAGADEESAEGESEGISRNCLNQRTTSSLTSSAALAWGIGDHLLVQHFPRDTHFHRVVREIFFLFQMHLVPNTSSVGMTMHLCDVAFDELEKAFGAGVPPALFAVAAAGIPLFAMSQGNYVEKRVLDQFFPPIAAGVLASRRATQFVNLLTSRAQREKSSGRGGKIDHAAIAAQAEAQANADTRTIITLLLFCCQAFAVCRGTVRVVRVMFSEAELVLRQTLDPDAYQTLTPSARRRRIEKEIEEVNETRHRVREERAGVKDAKRGEKRKELAEKVKQRRQELLAQRAEEVGVEEEEHEETPADKKKSKKKSKKSQVSEETSVTAVKTTKKTTPAATGLDKKSILAAIRQEEAEAKAKGKKVKVVRNTKRKKNYELTKKDLYGSDEDE